MSRIRALGGTAAALALLLAAAACDAEPTPDTDDRGLSGLAGVRDAAVTEETLDQDVQGTVVVVDMEPDADAEALTAVLEEVEALDPDRSVVYLGCDLLTWPTPTDLAGCDVATSSALHDQQGSPGPAAEALLAAREAFPDATVQVDELGGPAVTLAGTEPADVTAALETALADPVLARAPEVSVVTSPDADRPTHGVVSGRPLDRDALGHWRALVATLRLAPTGTPVGVRLAVGEAEDATAEVSADVALPGVVAPEQLTPARYGDRLWPLVRAQLDVVAGLPTGSAYALANRYRFAEDEEPTGHDSLVSVTSGEPAAADELGRRWNRDAAAYLNRVHGRG